ncbi:1081_t:CDS:2, partial [Dentiscutata erythropus]
FLSTSEVPFQIQLTPSGFGFISPIPTFTPSGFKSLTPFVEKEFLKRKFHAHVHFDTHTNASQFFHAMKDKTDFKYGVVFNTAKYYRQSKRAGEKVKYLADQPTVLTGSTVPAGPIVPTGPIIVVAEVQN